MSRHDCGTCDACGKPLEARRWTFNRHVERLHYAATPEDAISAQVIAAETEAAYCSRECAWPALLVRLAEKGVRHTGGGTGPVESCARCGGPVVMSRPHVSYNLHDETQLRQPWLTEVQVHWDEGLAEVCLRCDGEIDAAGEAQTEVETGMLQAAVALGD